MLHLHILLFCLSFTSLCFIHFTLVLFLLFLKSHKSADHCCLYFCTITIEKFDANLFSFGDLVIFAPEGPDDFLFSFFLKVLLRKKELLEYVLGLTILGQSC